MRTAKGHFNATLVLPSQAMEMPSQPKPEGQGAINNANVLPSNSTQEITYIMYTMYNTIGCCEEQKTATSHEAIPQVHVHYNHPQVH